MLKRVNENEFKLNLQLFAEGDENKDDNKPETFTKEEFEAKLKEVDNKYASIIIINLDNRNEFGIIR